MPPALAHQDTVEEIGRLFFRTEFEALQIANKAKLGDRLSSVLLWDSRHFNFVASLVHSNFLPGRLESILDVRSGNCGLRFPSGEVEVYERTIQ